MTPEATVFDLHREKSSLREMVSNRLRELIVQAHLEPGQKLVERELCEQFGVSRTLLRESLQQLQAEGLIDHVPHRGLTVAVLTPKEARDLYDVRHVLEERAVRLFIANATTEHFEQLQRSLDHLRSPEARASIQSLLEAKTAFYATLLEGCDNQAIAELFTLLNNRITLLRRRSLSQPGRVEQSVAELEELVTAIGDKDVDRAVAVCELHVQRASALALAE